MNELEATRAKLKCLEMVEGTGLKWWEVVKYKKDGCVRQEWAAPPELTAHKDNYIFALGIVEGKPVWEGDELYNSGGEKFIVARVCNGGTAFEYREMIGGYYCETIKSCTWNPPKPKTVLVELLVEDVEIVAHLLKRSYSASDILSRRLYKACYKALEEMK